MPYLSPWTALLPPPAQGPDGGLRLREARGWRRVGSMGTQETKTPNAAPAAGETMEGGDIRLHLKLSLTDGEKRPFFGPGVLELLRDVRETGSIQQAARKMGLSYVKALKILRQTEEGFGRPFLLRRKGGSDRGKSELTPFGARFLDRFEAFRAEAERDLSGRFAALVSEAFDRADGTGAEP